MTATIAQVVHGLGDITVKAGEIDHDPTKMHRSRSRCPADLAQCVTKVASRLLGGLEVGIGVRGVLGEVETVDLLLLRGADAHAELDEGKHERADDE